MKRHNWGLCKLCGKTHNHGFLNKHHSEEFIEKRSKNYTGNGNPRWNGGRKITRGYVYIKKPEHPNATSQGYVFEHRLVMEKKIGRYLTKREVVHHINENRTDNRIENLELFATRKEHSILKHSKETIYFKIKYLILKLLYLKEAKSE